MSVAVVGDGGAPQLSGGVVADPGSSRDQLQDRLGPEQRGDLDFAEDVAVPEELVEAPGEQHLGRQTGRTSLGPAERLAWIE